MRLDRVYLFLTISDSPFDASQLYQCLGIEPVDYGDSDMVGVVSVSNPNGSTKIETYPCGADDDHTYHVTIDYRRTKSVAEEDGGRIDLNYAVDCVLSSGVQLASVPIETGLLYRKPEYTSIVHDRRESFRHENIDDKIRLTGVELDFSDSEFPLSAARVSDRSRDVLVVLRRRRDFVIGSDHYSEIKSESADLASTFVRKSSAAESKETSSSADEPGYTND